MTAYKFDYDDCLWARNDYCIPISQWIQNNLCHTWVFTKMMKNNAISFSFGTVKVGTNLLLSVQSINKPSCWIFSHTGFATQYIYFTFSITFSFTDVSSLNLFHLFEEIYKPGFRFVLIFGKYRYIILENKICLN